MSEIILLLVCGRLLGEGMQRMGHPAVMGQLIAGILLGPSVLGALWPDLQQAIFPKSPEQKSMIDAVSQLGVLMLLLLTGMETDLAVVKKAGRAALMCPSPASACPSCAVSCSASCYRTPCCRTPISASLFLGTALSISSVKIVAMVIREMNFMRRDIGQIIMATAITDDTIGWIIIAIIFGLAVHGGLDLASLARSIFGAALFLLVSFSIGR